MTHLPDWIATRVFDEYVSNLLLMLHPDICIGDISDISMIF